MFLRQARAALTATALLATVTSACSSTTDTPPGPDARPVVARYARVAHGNYDAALVKLRALDVAVDAFVASPSQATLDAARTAWIAARAPYGRTETFRYFGGPIDDDKEGPEGRVNGWPLDEAYIDYVDGNDEAGIVNHPAEYPSITKEVLEAANEKGGEANLSTGYHAIEFLLWGQDKSETGPGGRPFTDFALSGGKKNADRRRQYLVTVTKLLVQDLEGVTSRWNPDAPGTYGATFAASPQKDALEKAFKGMVGLAGVELSRERMNNAYVKGEQEEEHSCFSDNTLADLLGNAKGIEDAYLGRVGDDDGPGIDELVRAKDPAVDAQVKDRFAKLIAAITAIPAPFDQSILREPGRSKVKAAIDAAAELTRALVAAAGTLGVVVNEEP